MNEPNFFQRCKTLLLKRDDVERQETKRLVACTNGMVLSVAGLIFVLLGLATLWRSRMNSLGVIGVGVFLLCSGQASLRWGRWAMQSVAEGQLVDKAERIVDGISVIGSCLTNGDLQNIREIIEGLPDRIDKRLLKVQHVAADDVRVWTGEVPHSDGLGGGSTIELKRRGSSWEVQSLGRWTTAGL